MLWIINTGVYRAFFPRSRHSKSPSFIFALPLHLPSHQLPAYPVSPCPEISSLVLLVTSYLVAPSWAFLYQIIFNVPSQPLIRQNQRQLTRDIQFDIFNLRFPYHFYWTPSRLHCLGLKKNKLAECWKCQSTLLHVLWQYSKVQDLKKQVHNCIN